MLPKERKQFIVNLINDRSGCSVDELSDEIGVSETTIRRDLQDLKEQNLIKRTHGGAMPTVNRGIPYKNRKIHNLEQKAAIGKRAVQEIHQEQIVIFDCGSTPIEVAKRVPSDLSFVPITPMPSIARELAQNDFEVHLIGGTYRKENRSSVGPWAEKYVEQLNADLLVLGTDGIDEKSLTTRNVQQYRLKELMIENAKRVILVADHSKFNDDHAFCFANHAAIDLFITDASIPGSILDVFRSAGVDLIENVYS